MLSIDSYVSSERRVKTNISIHSCAMQFSATVAVPQKGKLREAFILSVLPSYNIYAASPHC